MRESAHALGTAMAVALHARGFAVRALPGHAVRLEHADVSIAPFSALGELASGRMTAEAWRDQCDRAGIADLDLGIEKREAVSAKREPRRFR